VSTSIGEFAARTWASRAGRVILVAAGVVMLFAVFVWILPPLLARGTFTSDAERLKAQNDVRATLLQALAGAFLLLGLYFTARTLQLNREGQITERFTRAIDQLGDSGVAVRLGGIYALKRIANDSPKDRQTIFEVLAAFIRENSRPDESEPEHSRATDTDEEQLREHPVDAREDVRAAATVLGKQKASVDVRPLDLQGANLSATNLSNLSFAGALLANANLESTNLWFANLENAILLNANLRYAWLVGANLTSAKLMDANLEAANLDDANIAGADFSGANITYAHFVGARGLDQAIGLKEAVGYDQATGLT
jgi:hypothetical protein